MVALVSGQVHDYCCVRLTQECTRESQQRCATPVHDSELLRKDWVGVGAEKTHH